MSNSSSGEMSRLFLPPINRALRKLDPSFFQKPSYYSSACSDGRNIPKVMKECAKDLLRVPRSVITQKNDTEKERQAVPSAGAKGRSSDFFGLNLSTAQPKTRDFVEQKIIELEPYTHMKYENWSYEEIMSEILPKDLGKIPCRFAQAGHLAHLNLREHTLPYKDLIATVLLDKNPNVSTVVNKIEDLGTGSGSVYRTFPMELLAGEDNTNVEVRESGCAFSFDFAKFYWNSRLGNERYGRSGPFAIPAAKQRVFGYANDLNPESYKSLVDNIKINKITLASKPSTPHHLDHELSTMKKVSQFLTPHNLDGAYFIRESIRALLSRS
ncbi:S-adenosyl-L-methionine-dependent methyltransferase [Tuber borchii]|uniref:S-adenosyl-L-methionine-dependent methyltransferase n=1 Tax=Tuber borchii TaxID=42251 RepID=A0A2T6ZAW0_TUBBO|nr:S-adenosyl-L-methionine-dependent methyltransferase [Tuber borchii]